MATSQDKSKWRDYFGEPYLPKDDPMESNVYFLDDAEWDRIVSIADDPDLPFDEREGWKRLKLWEIGQCLSSGGTLSSDPARWIGRVLQNIALGEDAKREMGLQKSEGRKPKILRMRAWSAEMIWLTHNGETQDAAALIVAGKWSVADHNKVKTIHNDLKDRRGIFKRVQKVVVGDGDIPRVVFKSDFEEFIWGDEGGFGGSE